MADVWMGIEDQDRAVSVLQRSVPKPSHAYVLAGPPAESAELARSFAAALLCLDAGCGECSTCRRVLTRRHPDVGEVHPEGQQILKDQAIGIIEAAFRSPTEGSRKVLILHEAERLRDNSSNRLLKTLEEPPEPTVFVLLTASPDELLDTVRSRCQFVALAPGGSAVRRSELLAGPLASLVAAFGGAPARLDGSGGAVAQIAADLLAAAEDAFAVMKASNADERERFQTELAAAGYADRDVVRVVRPMAERHARMERRARADALAEGLATLEALYRDVLLGPIANADGALASLDAIADARRAVTPEGGDIVLNWGLLLENLLLHLEPVDA